MKFNKFGVVCASLAISMVGIASSSSSAQATLVNRTAEYFGEDLQSFGKDPRITQEEFGEVKLNNIYAAEQNFLNALTGSYTTLGFEANEGFQAQDNSINTKRNLNYDLNLEMNDGTFLDMTIFDQNTGKNKHRTSIQKTSESLKESSIFNYQGGRYGIADANASLEDKMNNQFLNTNAGKNSSLEFSFENQLMSAFSFFATDFDRGGNIALEFTRQDGSTYDVNLQPGDLTADNDRGTANFYGFIADEGDYFTDVRFKLADGITGNKDMVGLDRMTFAAAPIKEVPEPSVGLLALGAVVSGAAFKKRKKK
jgi:hypothetical protein